jgi:hypothetical protein
VIEYALRKRLVQTAAELGRDELRLLVLVAERLAAGRRRYGSLDIEGDARDFRNEALEEAADGLAYVACALIRGRP